MKTSRTDPLLIAQVGVAEGVGHLGITLCPGKKDHWADTGATERNLELDLDVIRDFGAAMVITLVERHELEALQVPRLGDEVVRRHMQWLHLPIADVTPPGPNFEIAWQEHGEGIRARLRDGFNILVHCKGGLGRAGTVVARLLVELGVSPNQAIEQVRNARPGAIETQQQEQHVLSCSPISEQQPFRTSDAIRDRAIGALVGLAAGDAIGTTLEFKPRDSYPIVTDMLGGGPFRLKPGQWTDDTAMALALADSLVSCGDLDPGDLMKRFVRWMVHGAYSCTGRCFDIGNATAAALRKFEGTGDPFAGSADPYTAGNGSLMRLAPVTIRYWRDREKLRQVAADQSRTTHTAPEAVSACVAFAEMLADAIQGEPRSMVMRPRSPDYAGKIGSVVAGSWRGKKRETVSSSGYVAHSLEAALWSVGRTADFRSAVLTAANLGDDADTTAAITGQLAGAIYGYSGIPDEWLAKLAWGDRIKEAAIRLVDASFNQPGWRDPA